MSRATILLVAPDPGDARTLASALPEAAVDAVSDVDGALLWCGDRDVDLVVLAEEVGGPAAERLSLERPEVVAVRAHRIDGRWDAAALVRELDLAQALRRAREAERTARSFEDLAVLGRLSAGILHDVANMVDAARRYARLAARDEASPEQRSSTLAATVAALDRATEVLRTTLDFARETAVREPPRPLPDLVHEALRYVEDLSGGVAVRLELATGRAPVFGAFLQVLVNLLRNACRACGGRGTIVVRSCREGDRLRVSIEDSGSGFEPALAERLFEPFFRGVADSPGTGLGLTLSRRLVERAGGRLEAESSGPGRGARFVADLPADERRGPAVPAEAPPA